jgi:hypothetical protein
MLYVVRRRVAPVTNQGNKHPALGVVVQFTFPELLQHSHVALGPNKTMHNNLSAQRVSMDCHNQKQPDIETGRKQKKRYGRP